LIKSQRFEALSSAHELSFDIEERREIDVKMGMTSRELVMATIRHQPTGKMPAENRWKRYLFL